MCTNQRYIFNRYSRKAVLVKCGHCPACLQEKACARANRIRNNFDGSHIALFVTLTYTNDFVPYVRRSDLFSDSLDVHVYRNCTGRFTYSRFFGLSFKKVREITILDSVYVPEESRLDGSVRDLPSLNGLGHDYVGVTYYPDLQNFFKRLRQILIRDYEKEPDFSYYSCSELGGHTYRPHFHALLFIRPDDEEIFRCAILKAWPYADKRRTKKYIEIAKDASSYVASYVNSNTSLYPLFQVSAFKPSHSMSKGFGVVLDCFSLRSILSKIDQRDLHYYSRKKFDGTSQSVPLSLPEYVVNRYFPRFKGLGRVTSPQLRCILLSPESVGTVLGDYKYLINYHDKYLDCSWSLPVDCRSDVDNICYSYSPMETYQIYVRLENAFQRFHVETGLGRFDYCHYYMLVWSLLSLTRLKDSLIGVETVEDWSNYYENANDLEFSLVQNDSLQDLDLDLQLDPNKRVDIVSKTNNFTVLYDKLDKRKKVTNYIMAKTGHFV